MHIQMLAMTICGSKSSKLAIYFLIILSLSLLSFKSFAQKEDIDKFKNLIIAKWFGSQKIFDIKMSLKIEGIPFNQLEEINSSFFPLFGIKKMFVLDLANINFEKIRKVLVIDNKDKACFLETENDVFDFIKKNYTTEKYGFQFIFEALLFLKYARGYNFIVSKNIKELYNPTHIEYPDILKNPNVIIVTEKDNSILCKSLFSTLNNTAVVLIEIKMSSKSISVKKEKEEIFVRLI